MWKLSVVVHTLKPTGQPVYHRKTAGRTEKHGELGELTKIPEIQPWTANDKH